MSDIITGDFIIKPMQELPQLIQNIYNNQPYVARRLQDERASLQRLSNEIGKNIFKKELRKGNRKILATGMVI